MRKITALCCSMILMFVFCFSTTVAANDMPISAPANEDGKVLESHTVEQYIDEDGFLVTEETSIYDCTSTRSTEKKKTVAKSYIVSSPHVGDVLVITLDADFVYVTNEANTINCPRYYSSYKVCNEEQIISYEETDMEYSEGGSTAKVQTYYEVKYSDTDLGGVIGKTVTRTPTIWVECDNQGRIYSGAK